MDLLLIFFLFSFLLKWYWFFMRLFVNVVKTLIKL